MKHIGMIGLLVLGWLGMEAAAAAGSLQVKTLICTFAEGQAEDVYKVFCQVGFATVFELPEGERIRDFVIGDPAGWKAESNGLFGFISPRGPGLQTSLSIITDENRLFVFNLVERSLESVRETTARVKITLQSEEFFVNRGEDKPKGEEQGVDGPAPAEREMRRRYKVHGKNFAVTRAGDDGVFAYIWLAKAQDRPALFLLNSKEGEKRVLEPVKYVDKGDYYLVHRRLAFRKERFVLKLGKVEDELSLK